MEQTAEGAATALAKLLDGSERPIYAIDGGRQIVYCNAALATWIGLQPSQIVGRFVEYHSEPLKPKRGHEAAGPLTDLCPPPKSLAGEACDGTLGHVARDGRLVHRRAQFVPLEAARIRTANGAPADRKSPGGVLVLLSTADLPPHELSAELSDDPTADELHRTIRRFRRSQADDYTVETLLGASVAMQKVRAQVAAAAAGSANVLIRGKPGTGRAHVARAIHYDSAAGTGALIPVECAVATEESLRRVLDSLRDAANAKSLSTALLENLENLPAGLQSQLLVELADRRPGVRFIATTANGAAEEAAEINPHLLAPLSTIAIDVPSLSERSDDLPLLAQFFLEAANRGSAKQVGGIRPDALDLLALYRWPGELDELRGVIAAAHAACEGHEITPADVPAVVHHAAKAAAFPRRFVEKIVLEDLLAEIEREVISRSLSQAGGNKSAAAELLGMTRPRFYRRLVQLGLASETAEGEAQ